MNGKFPSESLSQKISTFSRFLYVGAIESDFIDDFCRFLFWVEQFTPSQSESESIDWVNK